MKKNHKHLILNAYVNNPIIDEESCKKFLLDLTKIVEMDVLIDPVAKYCDIPGNEGVTGTIVITTSHMSIHVWPQEENSYIRMDIYSCKDFDEKKVVDFVDETMNVTAYGTMLIDRNDIVPVMIDA
jgi:S-adenosylmethionine/arginine decarboxylase-like enzyme